LNPLSASYAQVTRLRRTWYERRPHLRRHLGCPVISVGNLVVGGSGKTPVVAAIAELLRDAGHQPAILSRGYARRRADEGVVVVSNGREVVAPVESSGDEPQMLARRVGGVPVLVSPDRYLAGVLAQRRFGVNVLLLDDGFQHLPVARDVDLLVMSPTDLQEQVLPAGRLREPVDAARRADALLVPGDQAAAVQLALMTDYLELQALSPYGAPVARALRRVVAVAAIARPERFFNGARARGYEVVREVAFRDHHWFTSGDIERLQRSVRETGADGILTTEKDAVRLEQHRESIKADVAFLPMKTRIEPAGAFRTWLLARLGGVILRGGSAGAPR
jgi:tetraacyldisaccharide 4'-kinase